jgi:cyclic pyranopterin phosphate synthase
MPDGDELDYVLQQNLLTRQELLSLLQDVFIPLGFRRFRLTGGEPLLRPDVVAIARDIAALPETQDLAMTTNGLLLPDLAQPLYDAGLQRLNISLDSLDAETFDKIIGNRGKSRWQRTWAGIQKAYEVGFNPLKLNMVVIPGVNEGEVLEMAALTRDRQWHIRFIEFMPIGNGSLFEHKGWIDSEELREQIRQRWGLEPATVTGAGPADIFQIPGAQGTLGFISQMSECFCDRCNRMRLSADGWLRPCLLNETGQLNLRDALRSGVPLPELRQQVQTLLQLKPEINFKERDMGNRFGTYQRTMSQIGG